MQNVKKCVRSGFLLLLSVLLILPMVFAAGAVAPAALAPELAQPLAADNVPSQTVEAHTAVTPTKPTITVEGNAVITPGKQLTGFFEVSVLVKTPANQPFSQAAVTLKYDSTILTPVTWDEVPATIAPTAARQNVPVLTPRQNTVVNAAETYTGTAGTGILTLKMTAPASGLVCADTTAIAVVRFQYDKTKYPMIVADMPANGGFSYVLGSDTPKTSTTMWPAAGTNVPQKTVLYLANDTEAKTGYLGQSVWYQAATVPPARPLQFYYYNGAPKTSGTVSATTTIDGAAKKWDNVHNPATVGAKVLSQKDAATAPTYTENLLTIGGANATLLFTFVNKETAHSGTAGVGGIMLLLYDWDNALVGSKIIAEGDVKADVEQYITANLVHPDLKTPAGDLQRKTTYRGVYDADPNTAGAQNIVQNGPQYRLTNKLDYAFATWQTAETVDDKNTPQDPTDDVTYHTPDKTKKSYANGWARIPDGMAVEDVWTTFNVGELKDLDPAAATPANKPTGSPAEYAYATQKESAYFHMVDFTKIGIPGGEPIPADKVLKVKAVYQEGTELMDNSYQYLLTATPYYTRYNVSAADSNGAYSVQTEFSRINKKTDNIHGVARIREPAIRVEIKPDIEKYGQKNANASSFFLKVDAKSVDEIPVDIIVSSAVATIDYFLVDTFDTNVVIGSQRTLSNELQGVNKLVGNYTYEENAAAYQNRDGTDGFVLRGTMSVLMQEGTLLAKGNPKNQYLKHMTLDTFKDLHMRGVGGSEVTSGAEFNSNKIADLVAGAISAAYTAHVGGNNMWYDVARDQVDLNWHQLQAYLVAGNAASTVLLTDDQSDPAKTPANTYPWCRLHPECRATAAGAIGDWNQLLEAAHNCAIGAPAGDASFALLTPGEMERLFGLRSKEGLPFPDVATFKTAVVAAVSAAPAYATLTWDEVQYYIEKSAYPATMADADTYGGLHYWWFGGQQEAKNWDSLLTAVDILEVGVEGPYPGVGGTKVLKREANLKTAEAALQTINENLCQGPPSPEGTPYPDYNAVRAALIAERNAATIGGKWPCTWYQMQYHIMNKAKPFPDAATALAEGQANYWWHNGGKKVTNLETLLQAAKQAKQGDSAMLNTLKTLGDLNQSDLYLRKNFRGDPYATIDDFKTAIVDMVTKNPGMTPTWNQTQYYLIHGVMASSEGAANIESRNYYWWEKNGTGKAVDFTSKTGADKFAAQCAEAAYRKVYNGNLNAWGELTSALSVSGRMIETLDASTTFTAFPKFGDASKLNQLQVKVESMISKMVTNAGESTVSVPKQPVSTWHQVQHYLLTNTVDTDENIKKTTNYWWKLDETDPNATPPSPTERFEQLLKKITIAGVSGAEQDQKDLENWITVEKLTEMGFYGPDYSPIGPGNIGSVMPMISGLTGQAMAYYNGIKVNLDWYQMQVFFMIGAVLDPITAKTGFGVTWAPIWAESTVILALPEKAMSLQVAENEEKISVLATELSELHAQLAANPSRYGELMPLITEKTRQLEDLNRQQAEITNPAETSPGENHEIAVPETRPPNDENVILMQHFLTKIVA